ncbi:MarR family transcriptional regulator [Mycobacterium sp. CVI_P3]|uniref:MarR family transcriptional regulator n=1 Tax=Mycobacterium pinniadriaticum TaxID=2994102 RepID=A0ABT3SJB7_9MYCO|nr:MarR family transcriptional regulator [Mycobacterium pinniadriaticum]MCX2933040.1 MarR family transcriptional regulator [Mycobacterium pinniadriaticum]MCX2939462.1 MarR family transcriptional regulator [Mycobacterium pinniadriaticum]
MTTPRLDDQLCFALYSASRAVTAAYRPLLAELNLTYPQYLVLLVLWEEDRASVGRLCQRLHLDSGTLSPLLKRLEAVGYVTRERSAEDERRVDVLLTPAGKRLQDKASCVPERLLAASEMSLEEILALRDAVVRLTDTLNQ